MVALRKFENVGNIELVNYGTSPCLLLFEAICRNKLLILLVLNFSPLIFIEERHRVERGPHCCLCWAILSFFWPPRLTIGHRH